MADGDLGKDGKDESNSIENQRAILSDFISHRDDITGEVTEYIDDGYSGTNFKRPAFISMVEDMKKGKIDTLLTKDLSRLGRNYIEVGDYMEQIFPLLGVRYIAVNSNYDSNEYVGNTIGLEMSVMNLVNSLYSKDLSKKYRSAMETKWKSGHATSGRPPFGYDRHPTIKGQWVVEPVAAEIVKKIYRMISNGSDISEIIECLNEEHVMTPGQYREEYGYVKRIRRKVTDEEWLWDRRMMYRILGNYEYTGALVMQKMKTVAVGSGLRRTVPQKDRFITENHHEPIITKEQFEMGRSLIKQVKKGGVVNTRDYPLGDVMYCGNCGLKMDIPTFAVERYVKCRHKRLVGSASNCPEEQYSAAKIDFVVRRALRQQLQQLKDLQDKISSRKQIYKGDDSNIEDLDKEIRSLKIDKTRAYEAYAGGTITREDFIKKKDEINERIGAIEVRKEVISEPAKNYQEMNLEAEHYMNLAKNVYTVSSLSKAVVDAFIERVDVYDEQHIEIKFKFDDLVERMLKEAEGIT